jgi:predicted nucleotidyltransferase
MIEPGVRAHIEATLAGVARTEGARVLYAAESGSRAWGFGSPDSDYDVRFLYVHPRDWYVSLDEKRDVIERPLDEQLVDLAGWDIRKALRLLLRSNPALCEWLTSPIRYIDDAPLRTELAAMFDAHASPHALAYHYWSIARGQWNREVGQKTEVRLKKYFYVVRPLLSLEWVAGKATPPPMHIDALIAAVPIPAAARKALDDLLALKRNTPEVGTGRRIGALDDWAKDRLATLDPGRLGLRDSPREDMREAADRLYRRLIGCAP